MDEIDYANEWLSGIPDDVNEELVFNASDDLTWGDIVKFYGVDEAPYSLRNINRQKLKGRSLEGKCKKKFDAYWVVEDEDEEAYEDDFKGFSDEESQDIEPLSEGDDEFT